MSDVQFSRFAETEVAKLLIRRDLETHLMEDFRLSLALQVKAAHVLYPHGRVSRLQKRFPVKRHRLFEDPEPGTILVARAA